MDSNLPYIVLVERSTDELVKLVNAKMDEYKPQGGPFYIKPSGEYPLLVAQAMVERRTVKIDKPVWEYAGEISGEDVYRLVHTARIRTRGTQ